MIQTIAVGERNSGANAGVGTGQRAGRPTHSAPTKAPDALSGARDARGGGAHAQATLATRLDALATEIRARLDAIAAPLEGRISLSLDTHGRLVVQGSGRDRAAVAHVLADDKSRPGIGQRLRTLLGDAQTLDRALQQRSAAMRAAGAAHRTQEFLGLYAQLMHQAVQSPAPTLTVSGTNSSVNWHTTLDARA